LRLARIDECPAAPVWLIDEVRSISRVVDRRKTYSSAAVAMPSGSHPQTHAVNSFPNGLRYETGQELRHAYDGVGAQI